LFSVADLSLCSFLPVFCELLLLVRWCSELPAVGARDRQEIGELLRRCQCQPNVDHRTEILGI
jgi:hypothetical protein